MTIASEMNFEYAPTYEHEESDGKPDYATPEQIKNYNHGSESKATKAAKELNDNIDKHFDTILDKLYNKIVLDNGTLDVWDEDRDKMSKTEFKKYMKDQQNKLVNSGNVDDNGTFNLYLNDANLYWGHVFGIDYNPLTGEFDYHGIEG